ncbi:sensor histidine kinase [Cohnella hongkongensis]|uniref:histidine kinase n=1 Tax=Cohnella hongkongensis TaxID=178337 RepID=A0ABV9F616_9BACL
MSVKSRLALRLVGWLAFAGFVLLALAAVTLNWISNQFSRIEAARQFESAGLHELIRTLQRDGTRPEFDPKLLELVREHGGWLQTLDEQGRVTDSYFAPDDVPTEYGPGQLTAYWLGKLSFPYPLYLWIQEKDGVQYTLLYGMSNRSDELLRQVVAEAAVWDDRIVVPEALGNSMLRDGFWVQLLDAAGDELASFNKPDGAIADYTLQEFALRSVYPDRYGARIASHYDPSSGQTWVVSQPLPGTAPGQQPTLAPENRVLMIGIGALLLGAIALFSIVSFAFGQRFGAPIVHVLKWLRQLGEGRYEEPTDTRGKPRSRNRKGRRRRKYRVYRDVLESMELLSRTLQKNKKLAEDTERMRNEWIAGVSHDLKTPLSSIKGYAHILENGDYEWSADEVREFARVIMEKSAYLDELISDLALTYRLKNGAGAPASELADLNECAAAAIGEAANHPRYPAGSVRFSASDKPVHVETYRPWFQRIVDNLIANALLHNEPGTVVTVAVRRNEDDSASLIVSDNGKGMDEETAARLFERYYRGTDTEAHPEGSGLGMAITRALAEGLGGTIRVDTAEGRGTTIVIRWPAKKPPMQESS